MTNIITVQRAALADWARQAVSDGWLSEQAPQALDDANVSLPDELFTDTHRPLVIGFFGGTGAGKSTLLNRLAGEPVAHASAERPTSRHITVYVHRSVSVDKLPAHLPVDRVRTAHHNNSDYEHVMFIDMPDYDSVEHANRELVELWLPHIDVLLYVVSPERYRDDQGWQLLRAHAGEHAWLFVMNHWDRGSELQLDDFRAQLESAGLTEPMLYRTDCSAVFDDQVVSTGPLQVPATDSGAAGPGGTETHLTETRAADANGQSAGSVESDDFLKLKEKIKALAGQSILEALREHGLLARLSAMKSLTDPWVSGMNNAAEADSLRSAWVACTEQCRRQLPDELHWLFARFANSAVSPRPLLQRLLRRGTGQSSGMRSASELQDPVNQQIDTCIRQFINKESQERLLPVKALQNSLLPGWKNRQNKSGQILEQALSRWMIRPGTPWQQRLYGVLSSLCLLLPLAALVWVGWRVISAFAAGGSDPGAYLGSDFAVNSALLLLFAWLVPAIVHAAVTPSAEKAALQGLQHGLADIIDEVEANVGENIERFIQQARALCSRYARLWDELPAQAGRGSIPEAIEHMIIQEISQPAARSLDVRANTQSSTDRAPVS